MAAHDSESQHDTRRLLVDRSVCAGHGMCYSRSPEVVDCDDAGYPVILRDELVLEEHIAAAEEAVAVCPERALTLASS
ncbi:ferredoxin [Rhodococcus sp. USK10]|uniref:Probable ferredoxin FdxD n=1 Tax=Rhodococcus wratislaviensis TaxID=44752 RepID=A0A402BZN2_RHOWR|nr:MULTISPECIES: ferredoxin [Rhodococcus]QYB05693.1 ferredoxin [Rhodococcus sp. USK10]GCE36797.1 probable ferredoxin FdxD [Rhodococcus wratislaviensis]